MKRALHSTLLASALTLLSTACASTAAPCPYPPPPRDVPADALGARMDGLLERHHDAGAFSGGALVTRAGQTVLRRGYGCSDRQAGAAFTSASISDIGSVAKTFTAAAILQLDAQGRLALDAPLVRIYPDVPDAKRAMTIRQLLTHSSGLDDFHADTDFEPMTRAKAEQRILALDMRFAPGEGEAYSNAGYTLLAAIVERVTGNRFQDHLRQSLLAPAGLADTGWYGDDAIDRSRLARGYGGETPGMTTFERPITWALIGGGGMVSTVDDLQVWHAALSNDSLPGLTAPQIFQSDAGRRWSAGSWRNHVLQDTAVIEMGGSTDFGYTAKIQAIPSEDVLVVLLLNAYAGAQGTGIHHTLSNRVLLPAITGRPDAEQTTTD